MNDKQGIIDQEHLRLLTLVYYIFGAITCFFAFIPIFHVIMGIVLTMASFASKGSENAPPAFIGLFFAIAGSIFILIGLTVGLLKIYTGKCIKNRKNYLFCLIYSGFNCILIPYGTVLGIFSLMVLRRESVKKLFTHS